jgi:ABC-2 type transport system ATP-binding protein
MITVDKLIFDYPGLRALDNVSFQLPHGGITALVGPNGAGKSTLLRCMAALAQPLSGNIHIDNIDVLNQPRACHRKIGYLSDFYGLYERLTVRQCLHYIARAQGLDDADCPAAISRVSRQLHIEDRLHMSPGELSRGLRQRVAIAQAIIHQPKVLLLDEPASGLDPEARHELEVLFIALQEQGMTLLVSSHILAELEAYCTDMLVLRQGRIVEQVAVKSRVEQLQLFKLVLAHPLADLRARLDNIHTLRILNCTDRQALIEIPAAPQQQHSLLKNLLELELPVCEFAPSAGNLQDAYLQTIKTPA